MPRVLTRNCPNCGAPLPLKPAAKEETCSFCGRVIHVEWTKPTAVPAPLTIYVAPKSPSPVIALAVLGALLPMGLITALVFGMTKSQAARSVVGRGSVIEQLTERAGGATVNFPVKCGLNEELEIVGKTFEGTGTLIVGDINCKIHIKDSKLKGAIVVSAKNLVYVTIENSTLFGTESAIKTDMNCKVTATHQSLLKGGNVGLAMGLNAELSLEDSRVEGQQAAVKAGFNFVLAARGSSLVGKEYGVLADHNLKVQLSGTQVSGERAGLKTDANLELTLQDAQISGGEVGVVATVNPKLELESKAKISGKFFAVKAGHNLQLSMQGATLESEQVALCAAMNAEVAARDSTLRGGGEAIRVQRKPDPFDLVNTTVSGAQRFSGKGCMP